MAAAASGSTLAAGQREDVDVVVLAGQCGRRRIAIGAARMPGTLLAAIAMPTPLPQTRMPRSASPSATACGDRRGVVGVVHRAVEVVPKSRQRDAARVERRLERFLQREARVVGAQRDDHGPIVHRAVEIS